MTREAIHAYCLAKPGAFLVCPFDPCDPVVKVGQPDGRAHIFACVFTLRGELYVTLKCGAMTGEFYRGLYPGAVTRGWHCPPVMQPYMNTVRLDGTVPDEEIRNMAAHSYEVVVAKLPKRAREELSHETI